MDYRAAVAAIRSERDREIERVRVEAARRLEDARVERDAEIHRLAAAGMTRGQIAAAVGYSPAQVFEIASGRREEYNLRRLEHWRRGGGGLRLVEAGEMRRTA